MTMHCHLASSTKLYLNRRLVGVFSSNKRSGTGERASSLFPGFAFLNTVLGVIFRGDHVLLRRFSPFYLFNYKMSAGKHGKSWIAAMSPLFLCGLYRLYRACALDGLSFYERATIFCWLNSGKTPFPNKIRIPGAYFLTDKECEKSLPCPAPPIDDADKQLVPREAHHNLEMLECLQRKAVLIHQNISATNCGNQNVPIHSGRRRLNIKCRFIQLSKSDGYFSDNLASASPRLEGEVDVLTKHLLAYNVAIIALNCSQ